MQHRHVIRRIQLRMNTHGQGDPFQLRQRSEALCTRQIPDQIEKVLSRFPSDDVIEIPPVEITVKLDNWDLLEAEILRRTAEEVEKILKSSITAPRSSPGSKDDFIAQKNLPLKPEPKVHPVLDTFMHYLHHGILPWWADYSSVAELETDVIATWGGLSHVEQRQSLLQEFSKPAGLPSAIQRLVNQFSPSFVDRIIRTLDAETAQSFSLLQNLIDEKRNRQPYQNELLQHIRRQFTIALVERLIRDKKDAIRNFIRLTSDSLSVEHFIETQLRAMEEIPDLQKAVADFLESNAAQSPAGPPLRRDNLKPEPQVKTDYLFVTNAGLVLLHPFLEKFFRHRHLLNDEGALRENATARAIHLLQFLASGKEDEPEFRMILNKILCGVPVPFPVEKTEITVKEKQACEELLQAVIGHWAALKNTSPAALQHTFLMREGKLEFNENGWLLKVAQRTEDILLDRLPWSISRIKTPWMKQWLLVEWNS